MIVCQGIPVTLEDLRAIAIGALSGRSVSMRELQRTDRLREARDLRGLLLFRGLTLADWCRQHGEYPGTVHHALTGRRRGPKSKRIVMQLREELGI